MRVPVPDVLLPAAELGRIHFIGIGGAGLSAIARIMARRGLPVTGSDNQDTPFLPSLRELGVTCHLGYAAGHLGDADTVVVTTAARDDNPEVLEAQRRGLRVLPRSAGLAAVMAGQRVLAVAGTHGKTSASSLLTAALLHAGADPAYAIGGVLSATGLNADAGSDALFVAEADESDGAFLVYSPYAAIVTNIEADHLDQWGTEEAYRAAFTEFVGRIDADGLLVTWADSDATRDLAAAARAAGRRVITYGRSTDADVTPADLEVELLVPGEHNVMNALGALALGAALGFDAGSLRAGLASYAGTARRMELKGAARGVRVYDSYAHHPTEIAGDLQAARSVAGPGRVIAAFQPHLVSRTRIFGAEMGAALGAADEVVVLDVYLARDEVDPDVTGALVADAVPLPEGCVTFVPDFDDVPAELVRRASDGDLIITLGAGTITSIGPRVLELLADR
ncbi:UDP-N-acetylmuramate--L-alanine ligase [Nocardioides sp. InS609-2]|uniref:UDP-N-acetylmuramate--L-alanine ligase n=1 Tax=Nocardioides sp. InS609-2 TaxID=2760705 RepID=UPI0020C0C74A|nr:UDP-N-acetylmuramate--L-alanine ligase [Nocardioides sp. InS609-2]